jgi:hypothetical protein
VQRHAIEPEGQRRVIALQLLEAIDDLLVHAGACITT